MSAYSLSRLIPIFTFLFRSLFLEVGTLTSVLLAIQHTFSSSGLLTIHVDGGFAKATVTYKAAPKIIVCSSRGSPFSPLCFPIFPFGLCSASARVPRRRQGIGVRQPGRAAADPNRVTCLHERMHRKPAKLGAGAQAPMVTKVQ